MNRYFVTLFVSAFSVGVLLSCGIANSSETRIFVTSMKQVDLAVTSGGKGTTLIWDRTRFKSDTDAQLMLDVLRISQAWQSWFLENGTDIFLKDAGIRVVYINPINLIDVSRRGDLMMKWFSGHLHRNRELQFHADLLLDEIPRELDFIGPDFKMMFDRHIEKMHGSMIDAFSDWVDERDFEVVKPAKVGTPRCESLFMTTPLLRAL